MLLKAERRRDVKPSQLQIVKKCAQGSAYLLKSIVKAFPGSRATGNVRHKSPVEFAGRHVGLVYNNNVGFHATKLAFRADRRK